MLALHPTAWGLAGAILFWIWGGLVPLIDWNAVEIMIGRNLLRGYGLVWAPLDPPSLWRPPLGGLLCAAVELFTADPFLVYRVIYAVSLTVFLITAFYAVKALWSPFAAHLACLFIVTNGALTARLVSHHHSLSHVAFLLPAGPALLATVWAMRRPAPLRLLAAGVCWGFTYLARWEALLFFAVTAAALCWAAYAQKRELRALARGAYAVLGFGLLYLPATLYESQARHHYGIWGASALSNFYASEAWLDDTGDEDAGFARAERIYGTLESNRFSVWRAIARNPAAFRDRLRINIPKFFRLFTDRPFFDPVWLVLLLGFGFDLVFARQRLLPLAWLLLVFLASTTICMFQIDPRYLVISLPAVLLILCGGVASLGSWAGRARWRTVLAAAGIAMLAVRSGSASYSQVIAAIHNPRRQQGVRDVEFARKLAADFHAAVRSARPQTLRIERRPNSAIGFNDLVFLPAYFAGTAIPWSPSQGYPRDKVLSRMPKPADYLYLREESLYETDILLKSPLLARSAVPASESYYLFAQPAGGIHAPRDAAALAQLEAVLRRDYPSLVPRFREFHASAVFDIGFRFEPRTGPPRVGCGVSATRPDGHDNLLFTLDLTLKPGAAPLQPGAGITAIELRRQAPWGVNHTADVNFILGVASEPQGALLNAANGSVTIPIGGKNELWLYACDDGVNRPGTTYQARVRIGRESWIESEPVPFATRP